MAGPQSFKDPLSSCIIYGCGFSFGFWSSCQKQSSPINPQSCRIGTQWPLYGFECSLAVLVQIHDNPNSKVHGANMGPIWGRQDPGGLHVGPMNFALWECYVPDRRCWRKTEKTCRTSKLNMWSHNIIFPVNERLHGYSINKPVIKNRLQNRYWYGLTWVIAWIRSYTHYTGMKLHIHSQTASVHFAGHAITYRCWD